VYSEWYQWPLLAGILLLSLQAVLPTRRRASVSVVPGLVQNAKPFAKGLLQKVPPVAIAAIGVTIALASGIAHASAADAEKLYQRGDYAQAHKEYAASARKQPTAAKLQFDVGAAAYKSGEFESATTAFQSAIRTGALPVQHRAYYNLGNAEYRVGQQTQQSQPQATIARWQAAVKSYDAALQLQSNDADAKFNRDLVQRKLAQLQQQQRQPQDQRRNQKSAPQQSAGGKSHSSQGTQGTTRGSAQGKSQGADEKSAQGQTPAQGQSASAGKGQSQSATAAPRNDGAASQPANVNASAAPQSSGPASPQPAGPGTAVGTPKASGPPVAASGNPSAGASSLAAAAAANALPGQLTPDEAKHLLDSLKDDEHRVPASALGMDTASNANTSLLKDW
jgi:Ca-activated chloride channel family protein